VAVGVDLRDGEVAVRGWREGSGQGMEGLLADLADAGVEAVVVTAIGRDGTLEGPDVELLATALEATPADVVASGGVGSLADLEALATLEAGGRRLAGAIVGTALHEGVFSVEEAVAACAASG
jgi:phosphoribosylformimino-5-aminoimidazole carboxamide ribotide isomerase